MLSNVNVVVSGQVKSEKSSLPVAVRISETRVLKLPIICTYSWGYGLSKTSNKPYNFVVIGYEVYCVRRSGTQT